jgi:Flp pilus assembly protein CpaB
MNQRLISVLVFAFLVAGCASLLLYRLTVSHPTAQAAPTAKALVAAKNLELGAIIKDPDVKDAPWSGTLPPSAVLKRKTSSGAASPPPSTKANPSWKTDWLPKVQAAAWQP